jgi:hypothetical protein
MFFKGCVNVGFCHAAFIFIRQFSFGQQYIVLQINNRNFATVLD